MNLNFLSPGVGTVDCANGHLLLVSLKRPEEAHQAVIAEIKNGAERVDALTIMAVAKGLEARGYVEHPWNGHTAYTDPPLAEGEEWPPVVPDNVVHRVPDDPELGIGGDAPPNVRPAEPVTHSREELEALGDDELDAMLIALAVTVPEGADRDTKVLAVMGHEGTAVLEPEDD